ncbi:hypothetical protein M8J76_006778 [Diaphorina citri]|nr:hypothetical protein M8J75_010339 [Diaphorina citri]KAI5740755.1 hypothetical protein M8J76_006778 [Diaphorina citri]KAI5747131.1 hypothetical protein M8J77_011425 [Diaphorina citri]
MEIKTLSTELQSYLRSGFTIVSPSQTALELVFNALDAGAKSVAVRAELKSSFTLQVIDDGCGIEKSQLDLLGQRYMTNKCHSMADLSSNLNHYGYRGECLASLKEACQELVIMTRAKGSKKTYVKVLKPGEGGSPPCTESAVKRQCHGATIIVKNFLCHYPVRQKTVKHHLELETMKKQIQDLCVMHPQVSFTIRDDSTKNVILQIKKRQTTKEQILFLISNTIKFETSLIQVTLKHKDYEVDGYISREPISQPQYQNIYINKRLVTNTILHDTINKLLVKSFYLNITKESNKLKPDGKTKYSVYFININCPYKCYEMIPQPANENRTFLEFTYWKRVFKILDMFVGEFLKTEDFVNGVSDTVGKVNNERKYCEDNIKVDNNLERKTKYCLEANEQKQEEAEEIAIEQLEVAKDIYSMKMVENFPEHKREVKRRDISRTREKIKPKIVQQQEKENTDTLVKENKCQPNEPKNYAREVKRSEMVTASHSDPSPRNEMVKETRASVTSLKSKIQQLKEENRKRKRKDIKKIATSFHNKRNLQYLDERPKITHSNGKNDQNYRKQRKEQSLPTEQSNVTEIIEEKRENVRNKLSSRREKAPSIFSKETEKNWDSSIRPRTRNEISNESIFTQPLPPQPNKEPNRNKELKTEPNNKAVTSNESIFTGVDTYELMKHYRDVQDQNEIANTHLDRSMNESCDFDKLYEVCNRNIFGWFDSDDGLAIRTPFNNNKIDVTPIKLKRKNKRREITVEKRKSSTDQCKASQEKTDANKKELMKTKTTIAITKGVGKEKVVPHVLGRDESVNKKMLDQMRNDSMPPVDNISSDSKIDANHKRQHRTDYSNPIKRASSAFKEYTKYKQDSQPREIDHHIDEFHYHPVVINGHFVQHDRSSDDMSKRKLAELPKPPDLYKGVRMASKIDKVRYTSSKLRAHKESKSSRSWKEKQNAHYNAMSHEVPMLQEYQEAPLDLDEYVNNVLSRSYKSNLLVDSQNLAPEHDHFDRHDAIVDKYNKQHNIGLISPSEFHGKEKDVRGTYNNRKCMSVKDEKKRLDVDATDKTPNYILEDIWEDNSELLRDNSELYLSEVRLPLPPTQAPKELQVFSTRNYQSTVISSPYFKRYPSVNEGNLLSKATKDRGGTFMSNIPEHSVKAFVPRRDNKNLFVHSTFFRKKFNLTPVLQSSNSNNYLSAENEVHTIVVPNRYFGKKMRYEDLEQNAFVTSRMDEYEETERSVRPNRKCVQFYNSTYEQDNHFPLIPYDENMARNSFFGKTITKADHQHTDMEKHLEEHSANWERNRERINENCSTQWKTNTFAEAQMDARKDSALEDTQVIDGELDSYQTYANQWNPRSKNHSNNDIDFCLHDNVQRDSIAFGTHPHEREEVETPDELYDEEFKTDDDTQVLEPLDNMVDPLERTPEESIDEMNSVHNDKVNRNSMMLTDDIDDTEQMFDGYKMKQLLPNYETEGNADPNIEFEENQENPSNIGNIERVMSQEGERGIEDAMVNMEIKKQRIMDNEENENVDELEATNMREDEPSANETGGKDTDDHLDEINALADTVVIENTELEIPGKSVEDNPSSPGNRQTGIDETELAENQLMFKKELAENQLIFNPLGLDNIPKEPPPQGIFQLKERYGFMTKGLSPLVLSNNAATVGQLEEADLTHMEQIIPESVKNSLDNECIEKIVNMEEMLVKNQVKSSLLNAMCHVTKDLLNVTFKVIAQVDKKYIVVLLNKTLLVAFDQHAVDERIRVEKLFSYYRNAEDGAFLSHPITPCVLNLTPQEINTLSNRQTCLQYYGLEFEFKNTGKCVKVTHVPKCLFVKVHKESNSTDRLKLTRALVLDLMREIVFNKTETRIMPSCLVQIINSEACRGAIMFGKTLSLSTSFTLIKSLTRCKAPFQCAHGRPSVAPLADVKLISDLITSRYSASGINNSTGNK